MCEVARNSVLQSGWELQIKKRWLGDTCSSDGPAGNQVWKSNVPNIRVGFRYQTLMEERMMVLAGLRDSGSGTHTPSETSEGPLNILIPQTVPAAGRTTPHQMAVEPLITGIGSPAKSKFHVEDANMQYLALSAPALPVIAGHERFGGLSATTAWANRGHSHVAHGMMNDELDDYDDIFD